MGQLASPQLQTSVRGMRLNFRELCTTITITKRFARSPGQSDDNSKKTLFIICLNKNSVLHLPRSIVNDFK